jgi:hypothetical protein
VAQYGGDWTDGASHLGTQQDLDCRLVTNAIPSTSKNLKGGWFDAGDYNKYVNFAYEPIHDLLLAYVERPYVFGDDYNIPESGNGVPDILDEVKWDKAGGKPVAGLTRRRQAERSLFLQQISNAGMLPDGPTDEEIKEKLKNILEDFKLGKYE